MALAFIVEGHQERKIFGKICPNSGPAPTISNGDTVTLKKIAEEISSKLILFDNLYYPIIVLFDRENRQESVPEIIDVVRGHLANFGHDNDQLIIGVADRTIESWIFPFVDENGEITETPSESCDNIKCDKKLENLLLENGIDYSKPVLGVELFLKIKASKLAQVSESFNLFYKEIKAHKLLKKTARKCYWLER